MVNCLDKFDKYNKLNKYFKFIIILSKSSEKDWMNPVFNYIMVTYNEIKKDIPYFRRRSL